MEIGNIVFWIGAFDAVLIVGIGAICAAFVVLNKESEAIFQRILPATMILVATSFGAGVVMSLAKWLAG